MVVLVVLVVVFVVLVVAFIQVVLGSPNKQEGKPPHPPHLYVLDVDVLDLYV